MNIQKVIFPFLLVVTFNFASAISELGRVNPLEGSQTSSANIEIKEGNITYLIINESEELGIESAHIEEKNGCSLLHLKLNDVVSLRFASSLHIHVEVLDKTGKQLTSFYRYLRHRHLRSRVLRNRHRNRFQPECLEVEISEISQVKITAHFGKNTE